MFPARLSASTAVACGTSTTDVLFTRTMTSPIPSLPSVAAAPPEKSSPHCIHFLRRKKHAKTFLLFRVRSATSRMGYYYDISLLLIILQLPCYWHHVPAMRFIHMQKYYYYQVHPLITVRRRHQAAFVTNKTTSTASATQA